MRTILNRLGLVRTTTPPTGWHKDRGYYAELSIMFVLRNDNVTVEESLLEDALKTVDKDRPWKDPLNYCAVHNSWVSLMWSSTQTSDGQPRKAILVHIVISHDLLSKAQIHAFRKYGDDLAEGLAKLRLHNIREVRSYISFSAARYCESIG